MSSVKMRNDRGQEMGPITFGNMDKLFPFHIVIDSGLRITRVSESLSRYVPGNSLGHEISRHFELTHPRIPFIREELMSYLPATFHLRLAGIEGNFSLRGQFEPIGDSLLFVGAPILDSVAIVRQLGLRPHDFSPHDPLVERLSLLTEKEAAGMLPSLLYDLEGQTTQYQKSEEVLRVAAETAEQSAKESERARKVSEQANQAKSLFVANMSHDIRTPLNAILGFSEIVEDMIDDAQAKDYLGRIRSAGHILLALIDDILDLSRLESGKWTFNPRPLDLRSVVESLIDIFRIEADEKGVRLEFSIQSDCPQLVQLDEAGFRKCVMNLLSNAVKFTIEGHVICSISCAFQETKKRVNIDVVIEDTGKGIEPQKLSEIFQTFQQGDKDHDEYGGSGLGLAIVRKLVAEMNGNINVQSTLGVGSQFRLRLNDVEIITGLDVSEPAFSEIDLTALSFQPATLLIVDDFGWNRTLVRTMLKDMGPVEFLEAENGKQAIEITRLHRPDCVLMDYKMPLMDGIEATRILKKDPDLNKIPVIVWTPSNLKETIEEINETADAVLLKPFEKKGLLDVLCQFLPYEDSNIDSDSLPGESNEKGDGAFSRVELDPDMIVNLPVLSNILRGESVGICESLRGAFAVDEIQSFAEQMHGLGSEYGYCPLELWGKDLKKHVNTFDLVRIEENLGGFERVVAELEKLLTPDSRKCLQQRSQVSPT
ncbi:MAG: ATP-binding protein [Candidatus Latescibacterota bacterium]|nr:ATP-binding protein [Candidatus Latescibacterota bacterium]